MSCFWKKGGVDAKFISDSVTGRVAAWRARAGTPGGKDAVIKACAEGRAGMKKQFEAAGCAKP
jgi:hypothetical protein